MSYQSDYSGAQVDEAVGKALSPDATPTENSTNLITSGGVKSAINPTEWTVLYGASDIGLYANRVSAYNNAYRLSVTVFHPQLASGTVSASSTYTNFRLCIWAPNGTVATSSASLIRADVSASRTFTVLIFETATDLSSYIAANCAFEIDTLDRDGTFKLVVA